MKFSIIKVEAAGDTEVCTADTLSTLLAKFARTNKDTESQYKILLQDEKD